MTYMLLLNCALKLVEEIILYYDARSKKHQNKGNYPNKQNTYTLLEASVSTERLGSCGVIYYRTDLLGIWCTSCAFTQSIHRKNN